MRQINVIILDPRLFAETCFPGLAERFLGGFEHLDCPPHRNWSAGWYSDETVNRIKTENSDVPQFPFMSRGASENCGTACVPFAATARYRSFPPVNVEGEKNALIKNQGDESLHIGPRCRGSDGQPASQRANLEETLVNFEKRHERYLFFSEINHEYHEREP
jgi:hypothetical protein